VSEVNNAGFLTPGIPFLPKRFFSGITLLVILILPHFLSPSSQITPPVDFILWGTTYFPLWLPRPTQTLVHFYSVQWTVSITALYEHTRSNPDSKAFSTVGSVCLILAFSIFYLFQKGPWDWTVLQVHEWLATRMVLPYRTHGLDKRRQDAPSWRCKLKGKKNAWRWRGFTI
jgi:hypothetical protein